MKLEEGLCAEHRRLQAARQACAPLDRPHDLLEGRLQLAEDDLEGQLEHKLTARDRTPLDVDELAGRVDLEFLEDGDEPTDKEMVARIGWHLAVTDILHDGDEAGPTRVVVDHGRQDGTVAPAEARSSTAVELGDGLEQIVFGDGDHGCICRQRGNGAGAWARGRMKQAHLLCTFLVEMRHGIGPLRVLILLERVTGLAEVTSLEQCRGALGLLGRDGGGGWDFGVAIRERCDS